MVAAACGCCSVAPLRSAWVESVVATPFRVNTMTLTTMCTGVCSGKGRIDIEGIFKSLLDSWGGGCAATEPAATTGSSKKAKRIAAKSAAASAPAAAAAAPEEGEVVAARVVFMSLRGVDGGVRRVGRVTKANGRVRRFSSRMFHNQATVVVLMPDGTHTNVKVFRNGHVQMTGARSVENGRVAARAVLSLLPGPAEGRDVGDIRVCLMNTDFALQRGDGGALSLDRQALYVRIIERYGVLCSFEPSIYQAVKSYFLWNPARRPEEQTGVCPRGAAASCHGASDVGCCKRLTVLVFHTGSCVITGCVTLEQVRASYAWIRDVVADNRDLVCDRAA